MHPFLSRPLEPEFALHSRNDSPIGVLCTARILPNCCIFDMREELEDFTHVSIPNNTTFNATQ